MNPTVEILRPGTFRSMSGHDVTFTADDLQAIAASYSPELHEAPVVVGHPSTDAPAYGWVRTVRVDGDRLLAELDQVDDQFAELHRAGRYKKRSAALYAPDTPNNPTPGRWYLRHVGVLGAQPPAVKGLRDAQLSESDGVEIIELGDMPAWPMSDFFRGLREWIIEKFSSEEADRVIPPYFIDIAKDAEREPKEPDRDSDLEPVSSAFSETTGASNMPELDQAALAARETEINARAADVEQREQRLREREQAADRAAMQAFADGLANEGRILPRDTGLVTELLFASADDQATVIEFADGDNGKKTGSPRKLLQEFLGRLPKQVEFGELSAPDGEQATANSAHGYTPPPGYSVDPKSAELHRKAVAFADKNNVDYFQAVEAVQRQH